MIFFHAHLSSSLEHSTKNNLYDFYERRQQISNIFPHHIITIDGHGHVGLPTRKEDGVVEQRDPAKSLQGRNVAGKVHQPKSCSDHLHSPSY